MQLRDALDGALADLCTVVFGVTLGEAECRGPNRGVSDNGEQEREGRPLEVVLAIYVSWANKVNASGLLGTLWSPSLLISFLPFQVSKK